MLDWMLNFLSSITNSDSCDIDFPWLVATKTAIVLDKDNVHACIEK